MLTAQPKKLLIALFLLLGLFFGLSLTASPSRNRKPTTPSVPGNQKSTAPTPRVNLSLKPTSHNFGLNEVKTYQLQANFTNGSSLETLDYLKTEVSFSPDYLKLPTGEYVDTSASGFDKILRVDGPTEANQRGQIVIELATTTPKGGPTTDRELTIATITFEAISQTPSAQQLTIGRSQVVNNHSQEIPVSTEASIYIVGS